MNTFKYLFHKVQELGKCICTHIYLLIDLTFLYKAKSVKQGKAKGEREKGEKERGGIRKGKGEVKREEDGVRWRRVERGEEKTGMKKCNSFLIFRH